MKKLKLWFIGKMYCYHNLKWAKAGLTKELHWRKSDYYFKLYNKNSD